MLHRSHFLFKRLCFPPRTLSSALLVIATRVLVASLCGCLIQFSPQFELHVPVGRFLLRTVPIARPALDSELCLIFVCSRELRLHRKQS